MKQLESAKVKESQVKAMILRKKPILIFLVDFVLTALMMPFIYMGITSSLYALGYLSRSIDVAGTGSMYPSLYFDQKEGGPDDNSKEQIPEYRLSPKMYRYIGQELAYGDLVAFRNAKTEDILKTEGRDPNSGFIKRIIGKPGDTIELRNGYVQRNGNILTEPYTASPRSTYGGEFIVECQKYIVPENSYFVLGDNRKVSADSRSQLGFVSQNDIDFYLPSTKQDIYRALYREQENVQDILTGTIDIEEAIKLVNESRLSKKLPPLQVNQKLTTSAAKRGQIILQTNDFSTDATVSGQTFDLVMQKSGYQNTATGEVISQGYFTAEEWFANATYFNRTKEQLNSNLYQDIGITAVVDEVNSCPTQVVVTHLGGYIPPDYSKEDQASWSKLKTNLMDVIPSWEKAKESSDVDQVKLQELLSLLYTRLSLAQTVEQAMIDKRWLTEGEKKQIMDDAKISDTINKLIQEINNK